MIQRRPRQRRRNSGNLVLPKYVYHATHFGNLDSIISSGLTPSTGSSGFGGGYAGHSRGRIFVTEGDGVSYWFNKMENNAQHQSDFKEDEDAVEWTPIALRISTKLLSKHTFHVDNPGSKDSYSDSFYTSQTIPAKAIEVWDGTAWVAIREADTSSMENAIEATAVREWDEDNPVNEYGEENSWLEIDFDLFAPEDTP